MADRFAIKKNAHGQYWWRLWDGTRIIADSGETYVSKEHCRQMLDWIKRNAASIPIKDETGERSYL